MYCLIVIILMFNMLLDNLHDKKFNLECSRLACIYKFSKINLINFPYKYLVVFPP